MTEATNNIILTRVTKIKSPNPPILKGFRNTQEVENFRWNLENKFKHNKVRDDDGKINTAMLYLSAIAILWWRQTCADMEKEPCTIET